jgi:Endonuclease-reverse transcriptase
MGIQVNDQFSDLLERLATFSASLIVVGDFNIHVDDPTDADANKFADIVSCNGLQQHVTSPTHRLGHTLDLFITRPELAVHLFPVYRLRTYSEIAHRKNSIRLFPSSATSASDSTSRP